jgi:hypothetical protein
MDGGIDDSSDTGAMTDADPNTPDEVELAAYDLDDDGKISMIESERARLGLVDARLEEIAEEGGVKAPTTCSTSSTTTDPRRLTAVSATAAAPAPT